MKLSLKIEIFLLLFNNTKIMGTIYSINIYELQNKYNFSPKIFKLLSSLSPKETEDLEKDIKNFKLNIDINSINLNVSEKCFIQIWLSRLLIKRNINKIKLLDKLQKLF